MEEITCTVCRVLNYIEDIHFCPSCQTLVCNDCFKEQECKICSPLEMNEEVCDECYPISELIEVEFIDISLIAPAA